MNRVNPGYGSSSTYLYCTIVLLLLVSTSGMILVSAATGSGIMTKEEVELKAKDINGNIADLSCIEVGAEIDCFDLMGEDGEVVNISILNGPNISAILIISRSCVVCEENLVFWNRTKTALLGSLNTYCVVISDLELDEIAKSLASKEFKFRIFKPVDDYSFKSTFRVSHSLSQTILVKNARVIYSKAGGLDMHDFIKLKNTIKEELK